MEASPHGVFIFFIKLSNGILRSLSTIGLCSKAGTISWLDPPPLAQETIKRKENPMVKYLDNVSVKFI